MLRWWSFLTYTVSWFTMKVGIDEVGDRKSDGRVEIINDGRLIEMMFYHGALQELEITYHNYSEGEWHGLFWPGNATQVRIRSHEVSKTRDQVLKLFDFSEILVALLIRLRQITTICRRHFRYILKVTVFILIQVLKRSKTLSSHQSQNLLQSNFVLKWNYITRYFTHTNNTYRT